MQLTKGVINDGEQRIEQGDKAKKKKKSPNWLFFKVTEKDKMKER